MRGLGSLDQQVQDRADTMQITGKPPTSTVSNDLLNSETELTEKITNPISSGITKIASTNFSMS